MKAEIELMVNKLAKTAKLELLENNKSITAKGETNKISISKNLLKVESLSNRIEIQEEDIKEIKPYEKHYLIILNSGKIRIYPEKEDFKYFLKLK